MIRNMCLAFALSLVACDTCVAIPWRYILLAGSSIYKSACGYIAYQKGNLQSLWTLPETYTQNLQEAIDSKLEEATTRNCYLPAWFTRNEYHKYKPLDDACARAKKYALQCIQQSVVPALSFSVAALTPISMYLKALSAARRIPLMSLGWAYTAYSMGWASWLAMATPERIQSHARPAHTYLYHKSYNAIVNNPQIFDCVVHSYKRTCENQLSTRWCLKDTSPHHIPVYLGAWMIYLDRELIDNCVSSSLGGAPPQRPIHHYVWFRTPEDRS